MHFIFEFLRQILFFAGCIDSANGNRYIFKKPLKPEEEKEYIKRALDGDEEARSILVERNLRLVAHIAGKYRNNRFNAENDDLIQIGTIGLIKAVNSFSFEKSKTLSSYASRCIENEILMYMRSIKKRNGEISLSAPIGEDKEGNSLSLEDVVGASDTDIPLIIEEKNDIEKLKRIIPLILSEREMQVINYRYGLNGCEILPQRAIAKKLKISRSYVSRIEKRALEKLNYELNK